jgi:hypothetical protein
MLLLVRTVSTATLARTHYRDVIVSADNVRHNISTDTARCTACAHTCINSRITVSRVRLQGGAAGGEPRQEPVTFRDTGREIAYAYRNRRGYKSLDLTWSYECPHCKCRFLNSSSTEFRKKCCWNGAAMHEMPQLQPMMAPLSDMLPKMRLDPQGADVVGGVVPPSPGYEAFAPASNSYNHILSLGKDPPFSYFQRGHTRSRTH